MRRLDKPRPLLTGRSARPGHQKRLSASKRIIGVRRLTCSAVSRNPVALCDGHGALLLADGGSLAAAHVGRQRGRHKIEQPTRAGCSRTLAEESSCSSAAGCSYGGVANNASSDRAPADIPEPVLNQARRGCNRPSAIPRMSHDQPHTAAPSGIWLHAPTCNRDAKASLSCCFAWWQVLGSNQRRLSRRFYRPFHPTHRNGR